jgi:hypothetical protein
MQHFYLQIADGMQHFNLTIADRYAEYTADNL